MNILHINTTDIKAGAAKIMYSLHNFLNKNNHNSFIFCRDKLSNDDRVFSIQKNKIYKYINAVSSLETIFSVDFTKSDQYKEANIIHLHNLHGYFFDLNLLKKIVKEKKVVWTLHDMWPFTGHCSCALDCIRWQKECGQCPYLKMHPPLFLDTTKYLFKKKKNIYKNLNITIITPSKWLENLVRKSILSYNNIFTIHNGIDNNLYKSIDDHVKLREKYKIEKNKFVILFSASGTDKPRGGFDFKGFKYVEQIAKRFENKKDILFLSIGNKNKKKRENIWQFRFIKDQQKLIEFYNLANIFLYPSLAESFGLAVAESMACEVPVVGFKVGGIQEQIKHLQTGYLAEYENLADLVNGVNLFYQNKSLLEKVSLNTRNRVLKKFTLDKMCREYLVLYENLSRN